MPAAWRAGLLALALVCPVATRAQERPAPVVAPPLLQRTATVEQEVPAGYGEVLRLATGPQGGVQVSAWREHKIRLEARVEINAPSEADLDVLTKIIGILMDPSPTSVVVTTKGPHDKAWMKTVKDFPKRLLGMPWRVDYVVWVPEYTSLVVEVADGETLVDGVNGVISIVSARGDVRLANIGGSTRASTAAGSVTITTHDRAWHGGNLSAAASGDVTFTGPAGFSAELTASAPGGVTLTGGEAPQALGTDTKLRLGNGGAGVMLVAGGKVTVALGGAQ